jgi:hypothetical protein
MVVSLSFNSPRALWPIFSQLTFSNTTRKCPSRSRGRSEGLSAGLSNDDQQDISQADNRQELEKFFANHAYFDVLANGKLDRVVY